MNKALKADLMAELNELLRMYEVKLKTLTIDQRNVVLQDIEQTQDTLKALKEL